MPASEPGKPPAGYAFAFKPESAANAKCLLTFVFTKGGPADQAAIRAAVQHTCEQFLKQSVEKKLDVKDFSLGQGFGAYCVLTDAALVGQAPKPEEYKVMGSGQIRPTADVLGGVSLFADDADGPEFKAMLKIIESIQVKPKPSK